MNEHKRRRQRASEPLQFRVARFCVANRRPLVAAAVLISLLLATGIVRLDFDTSINALLTQSDPYLEEFDEFEQSFPGQLEIYFAFVAPAGETVFHRDILAAIAELESRYREVPHAQRFSSLVDYFSPERQQRLFVRPLDDYSQNELDALAASATEDRLLTANLLSEDLRLTRAVIAMEEDGLSEAQRLDVAAASLRLRDSLLAAHPGVDIFISSDVLLEQNSREAMFDDLTTLLPIVILVCVLTICYCFRSAILGVCILGHVLFTVLCTVGILGFLGFSFNSISIMAPLVVVIIAVANSVHIVSLFRQALNQKQLAGAAMESSMSRNFRPVTLAALTTAIGFSSLNLCSSPAIQDFGRIVAVGILFAYALTLTLLPSLLMFFHGSLLNARHQENSRLRGGLKALIGFSERRDRSLFIGCSALAVVSFFLLPLNETDFNRLDFIAADSDLDHYYDAIASHMDRGPTITYGIATGELDGAMRPEFLRRVEDYSLWLTGQPDIESVASLVEVVKTIGRVANQDDEAFYRIPGDIDTVAYYLDSYEVVQSDDFPLAGFINNDSSMITLFVNARALSNQGLLNLDAAIGRGFDDYFVDAELIHGSGLLLFARMDELVTIELLQGYGLSLLLITLSLVIGLRSFYFGILSIIPNLLPAVMVFGAWGLFVGQVDPFVMMLFSISIGLVVDDTVHLLSHYLQNRQAGQTPATAINQSILVAGPALTITTLVLALGTTILIGANTLYFQQSAKLLVPIVVLALVLDLLYLPAILKRFDRRDPVY